jgi:hypothetical protein
LVAKKKGKGRKTGKPEVKAVAKVSPPSRVDLRLVPRPLITDPKLISPPSLPMRHNHPHSLQESAPHPEVRLVIKTRYMEQRPHVLLIESALLATLIVFFMGILFYLMQIRVSVFIPVLIAVWTLFVILLYKHFED